VIDAKKEGLISDRTEPIYVYRGAMKMTKELKMELVQRMAKEDKIIYFVNKDDILSRIVPRILNLPFVYETYKPYILAIAEYNRLQHSDLLVWGQPLFLPYFKVDSNTTRSELAQDLFGAEDKKERVIIYKKRGVENITPEDKLIILDTDYLRTGDSAFLEVKYPR
ncbi:MAG: hypothetical protein KKH98_02700, partial [Spirochaetes bacterium]|nr:hypothetical protein [Spirochaetota bacterium]